MNDDLDRDDESLGDLWFTNWEQQCIQHLENEPDLEGQVINDRDLCTQKAWSYFQNSASSIAQLYKDRLQDASTLWVPFQAAAGTVATLYKDSTEGFKRQGELGIQCGYQRRNKELLNWARKKRRNIRREDLISYLAGKALPPRAHHSSHSKHQGMLGCRSSPLPRLLMSSNHSGNAHQSAAHHVFSTGDGNAATIDDNLHMFREALAISAAGAGGRRQRSAELSAFMAGEFARHCQAIKRPLPSPPPHDVNMDSPTHPKRSRFM